MDLSTFIEKEIEAIVSEWAEQASRLAGSSNKLTQTELRNTGIDMLSSFAADMRAVQGDAGQVAKSRGQLADEPSAVKDVAQEHADYRLSQGFSLDDIIAEYRALRATVLRLWQTTNPSGPEAFQQMIRFNEAVDEALTGSAREHQKRTEKVRNLLSGILAHDLRSPLSAITNSVELLRHIPTLPPMGMTATENAQRSALRMKRMINDLLDFTRTRLGEALPIAISPQDLAPLCRQALDEVRASFPDTQVDFRVNGDVGGEWDGARISQMVVNLLVNAIQHGKGDVHFSASGQGDTVCIAVSNAGDPIPDHAKRALFDPLMRTYTPPERRGSAAGLGLGLYVCDCIAKLHHGKIEVESSAHVTTFTVELPRISRS
ncbi:sensor histidine kinase [Caballeronia novacaledonica]|uniref:sensor histidine kinase n=1 Tax=Caballeronia novacaledonica TaxID=1544861 RepID=UPI0007857B2F|nr:sensor histidine kinase [Caballeronia novacaledonica]KXV05035.1 histidine kinase [Caballeronia megalochromosomata]GJH13075.1 sensor histidine kinase [Caballeronia novacaledonica]